MHQRSGGNAGVAGKKGMKEMIERRVKHKKTDKVNFSDCCGYTPGVRGLILTSSL